MKFAPKGYSGGVELLRTRPRDLEEARRWAYAGLGLLFAVLELLILYHDRGVAHPGETALGAAALLLTLGLVGLMLSPKVTPRRAERLLAVLVIFPTLLELMALPRTAELGLRAYLNCALLIVVWFGTVPLRLAWWVSGTWTLLFALLVLSQPAPAPDALAYLVCLLFVVGAMASYSRQASLTSQQAHQLHAQAHTDQLTGLPNRRALEDRLRVLWEGARTGGPPFTLMIADIDHFKQVNDRYGHGAGDQTLRGVGEELRSRLGPGAWVGRWGGEEFMILLPGVQAPEAYRQGERLEPAFLPVPQLPPVTLSVGAAFSNEQRHLDELVALADRRMYAAKAAGRHQIRWEE